MHVHTAAVDQNSYSLKDRRKNGGRGKKDLGITVSLLRLISWEAGGKKRERVPGLPALGTYHPVAVLKFKRRERGKKMLLGNWENGTRDC